MRIWVVARDRRRSWAARSAAARVSWRSAKTWMTMRGTDTSPIEAAGARADWAPATSSPTGLKAGTGGSTTGAAAGAGVARGAGPAVNCSGSRAGSAASNASSISKPSTSRSV
ncbi:hypothetical protein [Brevundimonas albigilva]|uniref:hypothetical protein n=1 Tax=Brevundimonas albigilva TaxID=1312364 RepID=UPI003D31888A